MSAEVGRGGETAGAASTTARPDDVEPFVRGAPWKAGAGATYPRADPRDFTRLPVDTWGTAQLPVTVRLELTGDADAIDVGYVTRTDDLGYRGAGAGTTFAVHRGDEQVDEQPASLGEGTVRLRITGTGATDADRAIVYLPEGMKPTVRSIAAVGGSIEPAPPQPRWVCYGDSLAEGWVASGPAGAWPAVAARRLGLDVVNLGYAGAARGEVVSAEHVASLPADVVSITHGTNCWTRIPHSAGQMYENTRAFLRVVRDGHPGTPIVAASPVLRPDAEATPNKLGATLADLRRAMEQAIADHVADGDEDLVFVTGDGILEPGHLPDGIHPGDEGHRILAEVFGAAIDRALGRG